MLWLLIRLRYRLVWAAARSRAGGKIGLVFALILGGSIGTVLLVAACSMAGLSAQSGNRAAFARWILSGLLVNALAITLATGRGLRAAFSGAFLRRFPVSQTGLFCVRQVIGLLDPVWLLYGTAVAGLVAGFASGQKGPALVPVLAGVLYVLFSYVCANLTVVVIDRLLRHRSGSAFLYGVLLVAFTVTPLVTAASGAFQSGLFEWADRVLAGLPPGLAASVIADSGGIKALDMLAWCLLLGAGLFGLERSSPPGGVARMASGWEWLSRKAVALLGPEMGPLVAKALLYHFRCDRVRFNFAITIPMVVLLPMWMGRSGGTNSVYAIQLALFFVAAAMATNVIMLNQFGFDGPGIERYLLLPVPLGCALRAGSVACLLVGGAVIYLSLVTWLAFSGMRSGHGSVWMLMLSAVSGLFLFSSVGLWTSILAPRPAAFHGIVGTQLSWQGSVVQGGVIVLALGIAFIAAALPVFETLSRFWWLPTSFAVCLISAYPFSLSFASRCVSVLRHEITCRIHTPE